MPEAVLTDPPVVAQGSAAALGSAAPERRARVDDGLRELDRWLCDQVTLGLAGLRAQGAAPFERMAARMVDAQAPGVAGLLRSAIGVLGEDDWPVRLLDRLAALHLLIRAHQRLDDLPEDLAATVRSRVGYPVAKAGVVALPGRVDTWTAVGVAVESDGQLRTRRTWLWGSDTREFALELSFTPAGQRFDPLLRLGEAVRTSSHRYPGSGQFRVLLDSPDAALRERSDFPPAESYALVERRYARLLAADPWALRIPAVITGVARPPATAGRVWTLTDETGAAAPLLRSAAEPWVLLAVSRGGPAAVFGEWSPAGIAPIAVLPGARLSRAVAVTP